jgi:hypothetical protein
LHSIWIKIFGVAKKTARQSRAAEPNLFNVSLDALKQAIGLVAESGKDNAPEPSSALSSKSPRKGKKLGVKPLPAVSSLTTKLPRPDGL